MKESGLSIVARWCRRSRTGCALTGLVVAAMLTAAVPLPARPAINLSHLDWLRREVMRPDGHKLTYWQIYATPVEKGARSGAYKYVEAGGEGVGCVDDVARAAIVYAQEAERTGDVAALTHAREALEFVRALRAGDGTYYNFIFADGRINETGQTSHKGLTWWTARALWATAVGARVFQKRDPDFAALLRADAAKTVEKLLWDTVPRYHHYETWGVTRIPAWFMGGAPDVTAVAVLGLATLQAEKPSPALKILLARYAEALASYYSGNAARFPYHAHLPSRDVTKWHAYGAHMLHAIALAGRVLKQPALVAEAREEADNFTTHLLINGGTLDGFTPAPRRYSQIAYGVEPEVSGLLALYDATGEARYGKMAGLYASWLTGNNAAGAPVYDQATGRVYDGIDGNKDIGSDQAPGQISVDAGAESTLEGLLALQALAVRPQFGAYVNAHMMEADAAHAFPLPLMLEAEEALPAQRAVVQQGELWSGDRFVFVKPGDALRWSNRAAMGDFLFEPFFARDHHLKGERSMVRVSVAQQTQAYRPMLPPNNSSGVAIETGFFPRAFHLEPGDSVVASYAATARQPLKLDAILLQPCLQSRAFMVGDTAVAVVRNYSDTPRAFYWPAAAATPGGVGPVYNVLAHHSLFLERGLVRPH
jgi:hypothetical protein